MAGMLPTRLDWVVRLRGVAALSVFAFHLWMTTGATDISVELTDAWSIGFKWLFRAGYQGVDLFFVLSGFVIAWPYVVRGRYAMSGEQTIDFYQRRYLRIAPVYYFSIAVAVVLTALGLINTATEPVTVMLHLLFAQNFDVNTISAIRGVYWTLPTEIHYYLVFPLLLRWAPMRRPILMTSAAVLVAIGYRALTVWLTTVHGVFSTWTAGYLPGRIDQFVAGLAAACAIAAAHERGVSCSRIWVVFTTIVAVLTGALIARPPSNPLGWQFILGPSLVAVAIGAALYCMGLHFAQQPNDVQAAPRRPQGILSSLLYYIGLSSLSLYLWHTYFIDAARALGAMMSLSEDAQSIVFALTVPAAIGFSWLTYWCIERPFITLSKSSGWRRNIVRWTRYSARQTSRRQSLKR